MPPFGSMTSTAREAEANATSLLTSYATKEAPPSQSPTFGPSQTDPSTLRCCLSILSSGMRKRESANRRGRIKRREELDLHRPGIAPPCSVTLHADKWEEEGVIGGEEERRGRSEGRERDDNEGGMG